MFIVTNKALSDRKCDRFIVYVSANNVLGESQRSGVEAMFPIGMWSRTRVIASSYAHLSKAPEWVLGTDALEVEWYLQSNGNRTWLLVIKVCVHDY